MQLTQPVSAPLQSSLRFLPDCCPHRHWFILRCTFPRLRGSGMDLSCSTGMTRWVRSTLYAGSVCLPMTADERAAVLTARRAAQHFRLSVPHDAYECLCILIISTKPSPVSALCSQIHRRLAVLVPIFLQLWVHCPRASNGLLPRRSNLVGYAQRDARFDRSSLSNNHYQQLSRSQRSMGRTVCSFHQTFISVAVQITTK
jgi:hypothetical protein